MATEYKPGQEVERSGIYKVVHDNYHAQDHEVTCVFGKRFPPCHHCGPSVRFLLVRAAQHIDSNEYFRR
jgi:hypothetical protein